MTDHIATIEFTTGQSWFKGGESGTTVQAVCSCGWEGPMHSDTLANQIRADRMANRHERMSNAAPWYPLDDQGQAIMRRSQATDATVQRHLYADGSVRVVVYRSGVLAHGRYFPAAM